MSFDPAELVELSRLLDEALDIAPGDLERWLAALPPDQQRLRPQLQALLARHRADTHDFLADGPRLAHDVPDPFEPRAGEHVGPYVLIRELGQGGMGTVWLASRTDGTLKRTIALKLPRMVWGARLAQRMERERDIVARLEHPNIARLYDAGVDARGRPFLALEFIDGQPIDEWCDAQALSTRDRLALVLQVAHAVSYAHGCLVVHRDLKPSNILVSRDGMAHLLDFGIAKLIETVDGPDGEPTMTQARLLTPRYASPEQVEGRPITVASDVYSLGILLYELLAHQHPFDGQLGSSAQLRDAILGAEPVPPSRRVADRSLGRELHGELDAIVGKALKRRIPERYATAAALADDIARYLRGDVVLARPDSRWYRLRKAAIRHRVGLSATAVATTAVVLGLAMTLMQAQRTTQELQRAQLAAQFAAEILRPPVVGVDQASRPSSTDFIDRGAKLIRTRFAGQPALQAQLYGVVSQTYADMGAGALAIDYALLQIKALGEAGNSESDNARATLLLARALDIDDRDAEAEAAKAARMAQHDEDVRTEALALLSRIQFNNGEFDAAHATLRTVETTLSHSPRPSVRAWAEVYMVQALLRPQDRVAIELWQRSASFAVRAEGEQSAFAVMARMDAAQTLMGDGHMDAGANLLSDDHFEAARDFVRAAQAAVRDSGAAGEISLAWRNVEWWSMLHRFDRATYKEASAAIERERAFLAERSNVVPPVVRAKADFFVARARLSWGDLSGARELLDSSAATLKTGAAASWPLLRLQLLSTESDLAMMSGRHRDAEALIRAWAPIRAQISDGSLEDKAAATVALAVNLDFEGRHDEASKALGSLPPQLKEKPFYAMALAQAMFHAGDASGALRILSRIDSSIAHEADAVELLKGEILCGSGVHGEGLELLLRAIGRQVNQFSSNSPVLARTRAVAGRCALAAGRQAMARNLAEQARAGFVGDQPVSPYYTTPLRLLDRAIGTTARASQGLASR
jgi:serine/threonine-protein kinase